MNYTIAAISTAIGRGAIGIVRMSGPGVLKLLKKVWTSDHRSVDNLETHRLYYGKITGLSTVDNVLAVYMAAPHSYTGEDVAEIHCHGGSLVTAKVLETLLAAGASPAEPGEFTRRAFLNGKMDLTQAEAVADIISASSERALKIAEEQLAGRLSHELRAIKEDFKEAKAFVEATIDFPEEDIGMIEHEEIGKKINVIIKKLARLSETYNDGRILANGVRVVIVGKPNAGKSSVLNALLGSDRAIVHHTPGTTRDIIEENVQIDGILFRLIDTAGIRDAICEIEKMGIARARMKISEADIAIVVLDATRPMDKDDEQIMAEVAGLKKIVICNKIDSLRATPVCCDDFLPTSAKTGDGIEILKSRLVQFVHSTTDGETEGPIITSLRHKCILDETLAALISADTTIKNRESAEFIAHHLRVAMDSLGKITGEVTTEDVLNEIFSKFCIGK